MDNSVVACTEVIKDRKKYKYISLNPTLARRVKILDVHLKKIFPDLTLMVKDGLKPNTEF